MSGILRLTSTRGHEVELEVEYHTPRVTVSEIKIGDVYHPWHAVNDRFKVEIIEDIEAARAKIVEFYLADATLPQEGFTTAREPLKANLRTAKENWDFENCRVVSCPNQSNILEIGFDSVTYRAVP